MRAVDIIAHKRDGQVLSKEEIQFFVEGFTKGEIADYQAAAWAMAVFIRGMNEEEATALTIAMANSGRMLDLSSIAPRVLDKHSSGGVGDKTTLVVGPLIAAVGLPFGKMSGRGLGFSGGTLDKLESIPGYRSDLTTEEFVTQLKEHGIVVSGQTHELAPADGKLYSLRDVTATVNSLPLIASSIMSKKIAAGAQVILLDVKVGRGAFMKTEEEATALAELMVKIGRLAGRQINDALRDRPQQHTCGTGIDAVTGRLRHITGRRVAAVISDMNQPLGNAVGNALEVVEAIETLKGNGPHDFVEHCIVVASQLLLLAQAAQTDTEARDRIQKALADGSALAKFREWIDAQGGDTRVIDDYSVLPQARIVEQVTSPNEGYISGIDAQEVGLTVVDLGGGRAKKGDDIDRAVGVVLQRKIGDVVHKGDPLFALHADSQARFGVAKKRLIGSFSYSLAPPPEPPLIHKIVR